MWRVIRSSIGLTEIGGGALMMSQALYPPSPTGGQTPTGWALLFAESLGIAAIMAGVTLCRNTRAGYRMSLSVQAIQILRVYGGNYIFAVIIGPQVLINFATPGFIPMGGLVGFGATIYLTLYQITLSAKGVGINVLALVAAWELLMRMPHDSE